ncbi:MULTISPECIES: hypothetical protein [Actinomycetes]
MDSLPLLSTLAGAAIGIVATVVADRNRWKHDDAKEALRLRLDIYTQYTTAVKVLGETLRALAQREHPSDTACAASATATPPAPRSAARRTAPAGRPAVSRRPGCASSCVRTSASAR